MYTITDNTSVSVSTIKVRLCEK